MRAVVWCVPFCLALLGQEPPAVPDQRTLIGNRFFGLEVAHTPAAREQGLMDREELGDGAGMLFVFPEERELSFWMRRCLFDLDIVFLDAAGIVVDIQTMRIQPPRRRGETEMEYQRRLPLHKSKAPAQFAIELPGGCVEYTGLRVGDRVALDLPLLLRLVAGEVAGDE